jgi:predicted PurR-regulated permease PerM
MTVADSTFLYLGWAALLLAVVMLRLSAKMRAPFFIAVILAVMFGEPSSRVARVPDEIVAMTD